MCSWELRDGRFEPQHPQRIGICRVLLETERPRMRGKEARGAGPGNLFVRQETFIAPFTIQGELAGRSAYLGIATNGQPASKSASFILTREDLGRALAVGRVRR